MKNKILLLSVLMLSFIQTFAQISITKDAKYDDLVKENIQINLTTDEMQLIKSGAKCLLKIVSIPSTIKNLKANSSNFILDGTAGNLDITDVISDAYQSGKNNVEFRIIDVNANNRPINTITVSWDKKSNNTKTLNEGRNAMIKKFTEEEKELFNNPYTAKSDKIDLYFDEFGRLLNHLPVNVDQNDKFYFHILCVKGNEHKYSIITVQGEYAPIDLSMRPFDAMKIATGSTEDEEMEEPLEYSEITPQIVAGPFTSEYFKFKILYPSATDVIESGPEYSMKVNKLYHVGIGVSFISTNLENPDFRTYFNGTDTTIQSYNGGNRSMLTFNAIWYWSVLQQKKEGSIVTSGRDILKDEPTLRGLRRVFPTVGVSLDANFNENLFVGAVYEFARGGSIIGGLHYGKVKRLAEPDFQEGITKFSGTDSDIKTENVYKTGWFIGINLDTRIFNTLFNKQ